MKIFTLITKSALFPFFSMREHVNHGRLLSVSVILIMLLTVAMPSKLDAQQSYTFTNAGATGATGPTQTQVNSVYNNTLLSGKVTVNGGIQYWVVPQSGNYIITALGAQGGGPYGGKGASMTGEFMLNAGDTLAILVGQEGASFNSNVNIGGGGASYVIESNGNNILLIAGGGGAAAASYSGADGTTSQNGQDGGGASQGLGGTNGYGGEGASCRGGGGAGWLSDGGAGGCGGVAGQGGIRFLNGGLGGGLSGNGAEGGFGGGGSSEGTNTAWTYAGAGGGYSGGGGSSGTGTSFAAGGGGSYNAGFNQANIAGANTGDGLVVITPLSSGATNDAGVASIDSPNVYCAGTHNVVATVQNFGINILDSVEVHWSVNGIAQTSVTYIGTIDTFGGSGSPTVQVTLGSYTFTSSSYDVKIWSSLPNGVADTMNDNDTAKTTMQSNLPPPTALSLQAVSDTTATISWQVGSYSNSWLYAILPSGNLPSGTGTSVGADSVNITGLIRATTFDFFVREVCPTGDTSAWAGPFTFTTPCSSPLSGTYTINPNQAVSNSNFSSFSDALAALNSCGVSGAVTFNVAANSGPYVAGFELTAITGASATNTVTFNGNGNVVNEGSAAYFIALNGVSYLTINDFHFVNTNPATPKFGIMLRGASSHINITNNLIDVGTEYTSTVSGGIAVSNSLTSATTAGNNGQYITITGNEIVGGYYGITLIGNASYADNYGHIVSENTIRDFYLAGVYLVNADTVIIERNNISRNNRTTLTTFYGTYLSTSRNVKIRQNAIHSSGVGSYTAYPIYITGSVNSSGFETEIINNKIYNIATTSTLYAIYGLGTRDYLNIYHNTIDLVTEGTGAKRAIFFSTAPDNHTLRNNILSVSGSGTGAKYLIYISTTSTSFSSNYNVMHLNASAGTNYTGYWTANRTSLGDWQTASSQDANSKTDDPYFANRATGVLRPLNTAIDNMGTPVGVTKDILDSSRSSSAPDIGAYEFTGISGDLALVSGMITRKNLCYNTSDTAAFVISNLFGSSVNFSTNSLSLVWNVTGPVNSGDTIVINSGTLAAGASLTVQGHTVDMSVPGFYTLNAHILPNADNKSADNDTLNVPFQYEVLPILSVDPAVITLTSFSDSAELRAISPLFPAGQFFITEVAHFKTATGAPTAGWPSYLLADDYIEITGVPNSDLVGVTLEQWTTTLQSSYTFPRGTVLGPNGTAIIAVGQLGASVESPSNYYYHGTGTFTGTFGSTLTAGRILKDGNGNIIDAVVYGNYTFPAGANVTSSDWTGTTPAVSSSGNRLEGAYTKSSTNWINSGTSPQDPNVVNSGVTVPKLSTVPGFTWSYNSAVIDSLPSTFVGPYSTHGSYTYVASYTNVCGTYSDTVVVIMPPRVDMAAEEMILPANACQTTLLPVKVKISNASLIEAIDFGSDTATVTVDVTGAVNQTFNLVISDNSLNNNMPLAKGSDLTVTVGNLNLTATGTYYFNASISVKGDGNVLNDDAPMDSLMVNPTPIVDAGTDQYVCAGATVSLSGSATNGTGMMYSWSPGMALSNSGIANPTFVANANQLFTLTVTNAEGCASQDMVNINISDVAANAGPDLLVCLGSPISIGAAIAAGGSYGPFSYSWSPGNVLSDSTNKNPVATVSSITTIVLTVTDSLGCKAIDDMQLVALSAPSPAVNGPDSICASKSGIYSTALNAGTTYQWQVSGGTITGSSTNNSVNILWGSAGNGSVKVTQTITAGGCFATTPDYDVVINTSPNASIFPITSTTICAGETASLATMSSSGVTYQWKRNGVNISGATSSTLQTTQDGDYKLVATGATGCMDSSSVITIVVNPAPSATITAASSTTICNGDSVVLNANTGTGLSYVWMRNNTVISSATTASYTAKTAGDYEVAVTNTNGCKATSSTVPVVVNPLPSASISASGNTTFCQGGSVNLSAFAATGYSYQWRLNGSNITGATTSTLNVTQSGSYDVRVTTGQSCAATSNSISVTVNALPTATATASGSTTFCEGNSVVINANTGTGLTYQWMRDGNTISGATSSSFTASQSGNYTVRVTGQNGCSNTSTAVSVTVNTVPVVAVSAVSNTTICAGENVNIISISLNANSYQWLRNGTTISNATSSSYSASASGSYTLVAYSNQGCTDTSGSVVVVVNALPDSGITVSGPTTFCEGGTVTLSANKTSGATYQWLRNSANIFNATSASYVAGASGAYQFVITDNTTGCKNTSRVVTVNALDNPIAAFAATNNCLGEFSTFTNTSTISSGSLSYMWSFGDGDTSTAQSPMHMYASAGMYQVKLVASTTDGCVDSSMQMIEVYPQPQVNFTVADACEGQATTFTNNSSISSGSIASYDWNFGDNTSSALPVPSHTYTASGSYVVTLKLTSIRGCEAMGSDTVVISPAPAANFTVANGCPGSSFVFNNMSSISSGTMSYMWNFGDGQTSMDTMPTHIYAASGIYNVRLTVTSGLGCESVALQTVEVYPAPQAMFTASNVCVGETTMFGNTSTISNGNMMFTWHFGDGDTSTMMSPNHTYTDPGSYNVKLMATSGNGCMDSMVMQVEVYSMPNSGWTQIHNPMGEVLFTANEQNANNYVWYFGDGDSALVVNPAHIYDSNGIYTVTLKVTTVNGCASTTTDTVHVINTSVKRNEGAPAIKLEAFPNPFNVTTSIVYELPKSANVTLEVYDLNGKRVSRLVNTRQVAGEYLVPLTANEHGLSQGVYLVRLTVDGNAYIKRIVQVK